MDSENVKINIVDAICGAGKTSAAINFINSSNDDVHFLYITPYLSEVERIIDSCPDKHFKQPKEYGTKLNGIKSLFNKGYNIVSTHALFTNFDEEIMDLIKLYGYTLIMDEVAEVVTVLDISEDDLNTILEKYTVIGKGNILKWTAENYKGEFEKYKRLCELDAIGIYGDQALLWLLPVKTFTSFKEIYILTYMFDCQVQRSYYDYYNIEYNYIYVKGDCIYNYSFSEDEVKYKMKDYSKLIHILENDKLNQMGEANGSLSSSWYRRNENNDCMKQIKNNLYNFFHNITKTTTKYNLWTTFVKYKDKIKGKGYAKGFLPCYARAMNTYKECTALAYTINRYFDPRLKNFFLINGIRVEEDQYALSELIQWIFRSALRDGKEINLYIPSKRMRTLLKDWIEENKPTEEENTNGDR